MTTFTFPRALATTLGATMALAAGGASAMTTTCADFAAMSAEDQMAEVAMMHDEMMAMESDAMATDDAMAADDAMATDDMAADDAMATDDAMAADAMATDDAMAGDDAMAADAMATDEMASIMAACEGNPDMMVMEAMPSDDAMAPATN